MKKPPPRGGGGPLLSAVAVLLSAVASQAVSAANGLTVNVTHLCDPPPPPPLAPAPAIITGTSSRRPAFGRSSTNVTTEWRLLAVRKPWTGFAVRRQQVHLSVDGPPAVALPQTRFPSVKHGENVKLDQHRMSRSDFGRGDVAGPFGLSFAVGDAGLRFVGVAEAAVMWHGFPAELVLDLASNPYDWDVVAKKVNRSPPPSYRYTPRLPVSLPENFCVFKKLLFFLYTNKLINLET